MGKPAYLNPVRVRTDHRQMSLASVWREPQVAAGEAIKTAPKLTREETAQREAALEEAQQLSSIRELKEACALAGDAALSKRLNQSVYVGPATGDLVLLQCGAVLCLVNLVLLARECAYQRLLRMLGGVGSLVLKTPLPLQDLLKQGILDPGSGYDPSKHVGVDVDALAARFAARLTDKVDMLHEYFMFSFADGMLLAFPNALGVSSDTGFCLDGLPLFLVRLCAEIDWEEEKTCLDGLCRKIAAFCVEVLTPTCDDGTEESVAEATAQLNASVEAGEFEDVALAAAARGKRARTTGPNAMQELRWLYEAVRRDGNCKWPATFVKDGTVLDLVSLDQLYRIFERC